MVTATIEEPSYAEVVRRPLRPQECALVVIDIQERLLVAIHEKERLVRNAKLLVRLANILGLPVLVSTQYVKGLGPTTPEIMSLLPGVEPVDKLEFGCFGNGDFCAATAKLSARNTLLLCGMEAHICVMQTALGALTQGHNVHVAADAVGSPGRRASAIAAIAVLSTSESPLAGMKLGHAPDAFCRPSRKATGAAAPVVSPARSAATRSSSRVVMPRPMLMKKAERFMR